MSFQGRHEEAIAQCKIAIAVDPTFGNPYNDIGAYLIELGRYDEAPEWLGRAKTAARYEPRQFPYFNLARVYVKQNRLREAIARAAPGARASSRATRSPARSSLGCKLYLSRLN